MSKKRWFTWTVQISVDRTWVEDGFDLATNEEAHERFRGLLPYATGDEIKAKVLTKPDRKEVRRAQGYKD